MFNLALLYDPDRRLQQLGLSNVTMSIGKGCIEFETEQDAKNFQAKNCGHWFDVATLIVVPAS